MPLAPPVMTETLPLMSIAAACQTGGDGEKPQDIPKPARSRHW
jgi:hypothetical protein